MLVDIESGSVGAAAVTLPPAGGAHEKPRVLFTARERIAPAERLDPTHFFAATSGALKKLVVHLFRFYRTETVRAHELHVFLHAPWIVSKTRAVHKEFGAPTILTERAAAEIVQAAERGIEENFAAAHREIAGAVRVVEKKITEFAVNGYTVTHPYGNEARTLEMTLLESFAPENAVLRFGTILQTLTLALPEWHGAAAACAGALAEVDTDVVNDARIVLTAGSETTECVRLQGGTTRSVVSVPFGVRAAARAARGAGAFHSVAAAEAFLSSPASASSALVPARRARAEEARCSALAAWRRAVTPLVFPNNALGFFSRKAALLAAEEYTPFFEAALREPLGGDTVHPSPLSVSASGAPASASALSLAPAALPDSFLFAEAAFLGLYKQYF